MVSPRTIRILSKRIALRFKPKRIVLFGSYAYGKPTEDSDVDLLVVMPFEGDGYEKAAEIRSTIEAGFPLDLLVRTPQDVRRRIRQEDFFLREVMEKGTILYEAVDTRMGRKGGG